MIDVVGIGAGGWETLGGPERLLVTSAERVFGAPRQLALVPEVARQERTAWPTPLRPALTSLLAGHTHIRTVVLASGDPLLAGIGTTLVEELGPSSIRVHPGVSSAALARARMGWADETVEVIRVVDPRADVVRRSLAPDARLIVLCRDQSTPSTVAELLVAEGFGASRISVFGDLGSTSESRLDAVADFWLEREVSALSLVCVRCVPVRASALWSPGPGLPDEAYGHDGQLTKRDVRATALAHLRPVPGQLLWDVGAGAGSVGIEWMRTHARCRAVAVERDPVRAQQVDANAARLGVPGLRVVRGEAPRALADLPVPDAVFVGGGVSAETLAVAWSALAGGGRLVAHAVTVETETVLVEQWRRLGGELTRISIEQMEPLGGYSGWKPARAVVQWSVQKPLVSV